MSPTIQAKPESCITLLGLGPGNPGMLTQEALDWLERIQTLHLRTTHHPTVAALPKHLHLKSFDDVYERYDAFEDVYGSIINQVLAMGQTPGGVTYAVPGHPFVAEATCPEIMRRAQAAGISVRVIDGLSFLEPTFRILGVDPFPDMVMVDAMRLSMRQTPGFPPSSPALIAQIYSRQVASDVKLSLMAAYPDEHPVKLVHGAGTAEEKVEDLPLHQIDTSPHLGMLSSLYISPLSPQASFESFQEIIARLRALDGCPWDREQTHISLRPFLLEEVYETLDALDREDMIDLQEELGDLLLQIVLHAQIAVEDGDFNIHNVLDGIGSKLIRRHPHVFTEIQVEGVSGVIRNWEAIKAEERLKNGSDSTKGLLDGIPKILPALSQAQEVIERVGRVDFNELIAAGEPEQIRQTLKGVEDADGIERENFFGELLLAVTALAYRLRIDAESALREKLNRFRARFSWMETHAIELGQSLVDLNEDEKSHLWSQSNRNEEGEDVL